MYPPPPRWHASRIKVNRLTLGLGASGESGLTVREVMREALFVPETKLAVDLLQEFQERRREIAIVVDEFGGTMGIVTLDNVLAEIVGDIRDEFDAEESEFKRLNSEEFEVEGVLGIYELNDLTELDLSNTEVSTVGGYVTQLLGHLPREGEQTRVGEYLVTVTKTDGRRVDQLHFKRSPVDGSEAGVSASGISRSE